MMVSLANDGFFGKTVDLCHNRDLFLFLEYIVLIYADYVDP